MVGISTLRILPRVSMQGTGVGVAVICAVGVEEGKRVADGNGDGVTWEGAGARVTAMGV